MRVFLASVLAAALFLGAGSAWAGTGPSEDRPGTVIDVDQSLQAGVRWILRLDGLTEVQHERTVDFNRYFLDQGKVQGSVLQDIVQGLNQRNWVVKESQDSQVQVVEAIKGDHLMNVSLKKSGPEPRLTVKIMKTHGETQLHSHLPLR